MSAGAFVASVQLAHDAGYTCERCAHCGGWTWWPPAGQRTGERVFCSRPRCEGIESIARIEESGVPVPDHVIAFLRERAARVA